MEQWRPIPGFPNFEVSDHGHVRSLNRILRDGRKWKARDLKPKPSPSGHLCVRLCEDGHHWKWVHRIVLEAFIGACPDGMEGCHNNGNPKDNRLANLRWDTRAGNHADKWRHGTMIVGEANNKAKLNAFKVRKIREMYREGVSKAQIGRRFQVTKQNISFIVSGKTWRHVA